MKKAVLVLVILLAAVSLHAQQINLGDFPVGQWTDTNYDAVWDFAVNNIRILDTSGNVVWDFSTATIQNFRVFLEGIQPGFSFSCPETERSYRFIASLPSTNVVMEIDREEQAKYSVTMRRR